LDMAISTRPGLSDIFTTWLLVGIQSFGGGSSTFSLIHQVIIKRGWMSEEEFVRAWALAQIAPGINLLKLTVMIGYRLNGWLGLISALGGLLLPSAGVTVLMTAGFASIRNLPVIQSMMKGILPATIGLSLAMSVQMAGPLLLRAHREGRARLVAHVGTLASASALMALFKLSPILILFIAGAMMIGLLMLIPIAKPKPSAEKNV
jgi:chromate transporter